MKILFAGTPAIAVPSLRTLAEVHEVEVLTNPDAPAGRGGHLLTSPVKAAAQELGLIIHQSDRLDSALRAELDKRNFEILVSFAFGRIFGPLFLGLFPRGGLNVHPSLLPRWRGPAPLNAAILARDARTGLTIQTLALEMDRGDILWQNERPLLGDETAGTLTDWAASAAPAALIEVLEGLASRRLSGRPQDESAATYCALIRKEDGWIDWTKSALEIDARIRAFSPWPGAQTSWEGKQVLIGQATPLLLSSGSQPTAQGSGWEHAATGAREPGTVIGIDKKRGILIQTGDGILVVRALQLQSKKMMDFQSFINGVRDFPGSVLGERR